MNVHNLIKKLFLLNYLFDLFKIKSPSKSIVIIILT